MFVNAIEKYEEDSIPISGTFNRLGQSVELSRPLRVLDRFQHRKFAIESFHRPMIIEVARHIVNSHQSPQPIRTVRLVGHTDSTGSEDNNYLTGGRRASEVKQQLTRELERLRPGISNQIRILVSSCSEFRPVESNASPQGRAMNRRVEVFVSRRAIPKPPANPAMRRLFENAMAAYNSRNYGRAIVLYEKVRQQRDAPEVVKSACLYNIGYANIKLRRFATAIIYFETYIGRPDITDCERMMAQYRLVEAKRRIGV